METCKECGILVADRSFMSTDSLICDLNYCYTCYDAVSDREREEMEYRSFNGITSEEDAEYYARKKEISNIIGGKTRKVRDTSRFNEEYLKVLCPVCKSNCVHIGDLDVLSGWDDYVSDMIHIDANGEISKIPKVETDFRNRNLSYVTHFWCEEGCKWSEETSFHKGTTIRNVIIHKTTHKNTEGE